MIFHLDCLPDSRIEILDELTKSFKKKGCKLLPKGLSPLNQKGEENRNQVCLKAIKKLRISSFYK